MHKHSRTHTYTEKPKRNGRFSAISHAFKGDAATFFDFNVFPFKFNFFSVILAIDSNTESLPKIIKCKALQPDINTFFAVIFKFLEKVPSTKNIEPYTLSLFVVYWAILNILLRTVAAVHLLHATKQFVVQLSVTLLFTTHHQTPKQCSFL